MGRSLSKTMRKIRIENKELGKLLREKDKESQKMINKAKEFEAVTKPVEELKIAFQKAQTEIMPKAKKIKEQMEPIMMKIQRFKDKVNPIVAEEVKKNGIVLNEFEAIESAFIEKGKIYIKIIDQVDEYKETLKKGSKRV